MTGTGSSTGRRGLLAGFGAAALLSGAGVPAFGASVLDVRAFGAEGDGQATDSDPINRAIVEAASRGGGIVRVPPGIYRCFSIRLRSAVTLLLETGAVIRAAAVPREGMANGGFDPAEPQGPWEPFQDFGHNHWHNSLIWGEGLHDVSITGGGLIDGSALSRSYDWDAELPLMRAPGVANKTIALKECRNVTLRDFSILRGGHFGILATAVDELVIEGLRIDTNRDGMDIDCCRNVSVSNCIVNSPMDDGICLKSSYALGHARMTENVSITGCHVTGGYAVGTLLDGTLVPWFDPGNGNERAYTGRIKAGTESNGGYRNIAVSGCTFESCRGFALETVDGGVCEDVSFTGNTMRDIRAAPMLYLRIGARLRGPAGIVPGALRRIVISGVVCEQVSLLPSIIAGLPGHPVEDVRIEDVVVRLPGGGTAAMAGTAVPEQPRGYPEPRLMGPLPAALLWARHVRGLSLGAVSVEFAGADARPLLALVGAADVDVSRLFLPRDRRANVATLTGVDGFRLANSPGLPVRELGTVARGSV